MRHTGCKDVQVLKTSLGNCLYYKFNQIRIGQKRQNKVTTFSESDFRLEIKEENFRNHLECRDSENSS